MVAWLDQVGDPSRVHAEGLAARYAVEQARTQVAELLGARNREVCFTSGATEAIAAACWGGADRGGHQVVPAIEHSAVRMAAARHGEITLVAPDRHGRVDPGAVLAAVRPGTGLVHLQWGNHEVGTLQPVAEVVAGCRERGVLVHVDAAQAAGHVDVDFRALGADLLSVSAHKLGGPGGVGALLIRQGLRIRPLLVGGDQERARRAGYENVPALVGFGAACAALATPAGAPDGDGDGARSRLAEEAARERRLTDRVLDALPDGVGVYGDPVDRLPHLVCLGIEGIEPQAVLLGLDRAGIAAHSGSACASESLEPSPVLEAMGVDAHHSLRVSTGWSSSDEDVARLLDALPHVLAELRALDAGHRR
jgi:cysteine desulfurase